MGNEVNNRILLLDEVDIHRYLVDETKNRFGYVVDTTESINMALGWVSNRKYHGAILEPAPWAIIRSGLDNPDRPKFDDLVEGLRKQKARILFFTGYSEEELGMDFGFRRSMHFDELLFKPADPEDEILPAMERVFNLKRVKSECAKS